MPYPSHAGGWPFFSSTHFILLNRPHLEPRHQIFSALCHPLPNMTTILLSVGVEQATFTSLLSHKCLKIKFWIIQNFLFTKSSVECEIWHFFTYRNYMTLFHKYLLNEHTFHLTDFTFLPSSFSSGLKAET